MSIYCLWMASRNNERVLPLILDVSFYFVQLLSKHPTGLEIQHALVSSAAGERRSRLMPLPFGFYRHAELSTKKLNQSAIQQYRDSKNCWFFFK